MLYELSQHIYRKNRHIDYSV